jgi:hypothetical protein
LRYVKTVPFSVTTLDPFPPKIGFPELLLVLVPVPDPLPGDDEDELLLEALVWCGFIVKKYTGRTTTRTTITIIAAKRVKSAMRRCFDNLER